AYGMESYGLAQRLSIPVEEAAVILDAYFEAFPNVKAYMERTVAEARQRGYTETLFGRRRMIPELSSSNYRIRQAGERQAMNAGIQGLAADIFSCRGWSRRAARRPWRRRPRRCRARRGTGSRRRWRRPRRRPGRRPARRRC